MVITYSADPAARPGLLLSIAIKVSKNALFSPRKPQTPLLSYDIFLSGCRYLFNRISVDFTIYLACGAGAAEEEEVWLGRHLRGYNVRPMHNCPACKHAERLQSQTWAFYLFKNKSSASDRRHEGSCYSRPERENEKPCRKNGMNTSPFGRGHSGCTTGG